MGKSVNNIENLYIIILYINRERNFPLLFSQPRTRGINPHGKTFKLLLMTKADVPISTGDIPSMTPPRNGTIAQPSMSPPLPIWTRLNARKRPAFEMSARIPSSWTSTSKMQVLKDLGNLPMEKEIGTCRGCDVTEPKLMPLMSQPHVL